MNAPSENQVCVVFVGDFAEEIPPVRELFDRQRWRLLEAPDGRRVMHYLHRQPVHVVVAESEGRGWHWKGLLHTMRDLAKPPELIVASRTADNYLWAEALNLGAYDVLPRPFHLDELRRVIAAARRHYDPKIKPPARDIGGIETTNVA